MSDLSSIYCTSSLPTSIWLLSERKRTLTWLSSSMTLKYNCVGPGASPMMDIKSLTNASSMTLLGTFIVNFSMRSFFTVWRYSTFCMANEKTGSWDIVSRILPSRTPSSPWIAFRSIFPTPRQRGLSLQSH